MRNYRKFATKALLLLGLGLLIMHTADASTGTEFQAASTRFQNWVTGFYGKMAAFAGTAIGVGIAAITKQLIPTLMGVGIGVVIPVAVSVINASFGSVV